MGSQTIQKVMDNEEDEEGEEGNGGRRGLTQEEEQEIERKHDAQGDTEMEDDFYD